MTNTAKYAPDGKPILVWVREASRGTARKGEWRIGHVVRGEGLPDELRSDSHSGAWDIPFWEPLPDDPE